ncbi:unnamed protein product [Lepeophtheirus salmonis]|uniref:(salmon louse) hypothetical protein n=1 Tax=Lepeophtheirus salmonis TaxID=72036 RepID=A0A7R8H6I6_LEPSM|nr:unnamed protein product [Lepeophtheirus salmonis]CAF2902230.1 unnamed protein product [Lepeophtheirus salmonis]
MKRRGLLQLIKRRLALRNMNNIIFYSVLSPKREDLAKSPLVCPHCASSSSSVEACSNDHLKVHYSPKSIKKGKETESCSSFKIGTKPHIGNVMLASKDIRAGDVVFIERPAVWGPDSKSRPVCLNCLENKSSNQLEAERYFCSKCGFPVCNEECENGMYHVQECDALVESKGY